MTDSKYNLSKRIGKRIKEIRKAKNIRQFELAEMINIEPTNLSKIENGVYFPREEKLKKIVNALGVNMRDLFDIEHIKTKDEILNNIKDDLTKLNEKELEFFYKLIKSYIEILKSN